MDADFGLFVCLAESGFVVLTYCYWLTRNSKWLLLKPAEIIFNYSMDPIDLTCTIQGRMQPVYVKAGTY